MTSAAQHERKSPGVAGAPWSQSVVGDTYPEGANEQRHASEMGRCSAAHQLRVLCAPNLSIAPLPRTQRGSATVNDAVAAIAVVVVGIIFGAVVSRSSTRAVSEQPAQQLIADQVAAAIAARPQQLPRSPQRDQQGDAPPLQPKVTLRPLAVNQGSHQDAGSVDVSLPDVSPSFEVAANAAEANPLPSGDPTKPNCDAVDPAQVSEFFECLAELVTYERERGMALYASLLHALPAADQEQLRLEQRNWMEVMKAKCAAYSQKYAGGPVQTRMHAVCARFEFEGRANALEARLRQTRVKSGT